MTILVGLHSFNLNGVLKANLSFVRYLRRNYPNIDIYVFSPDSNSGRHLLDECGAYTFIAANADAVIEQLGLLKVHPDLVIRESLFSPDILPVAKHFGARFYMRVHDMLPLSQASDQWFVKPKLAGEYFQENSGQNVIFVAHKIREYYQDLVIEHNIRSHCVYPAICEQDVYFSKKDHFPSGFRILQLGTVYPRKGCHLTVEAFHLFLEKYKIEDAYLFLVGERNANEKEKEYSTAIRQQIAALNLEKNVFLVPSNPLPFSVLTNFDVLTLHSMSECTPLVIFESQMLGKKIVSARVGGIQEQVPDSRIGYLFDYGDVAKQAELFHKVYQEDRSSDGYQSKIRQTYHEFFRSDKLNSELCHIYEIR